MSFGDSLWKSRFDPEVRQVRFLLFALVAWVFAGFQSCSEIRYAWSGQTTQAEIVKRSSRFESGLPYTLTYRWTDAATGETRQAMYEARAGEFANASTIEIVYLPGVEGGSKPSHRRSWIWPVVFFGSTAGVIVFFTLLVRQLHQPIGGGGRRPARPAARRARL